jgi:hypothetical protein
VRRALADTVRAMPDVVASTSASDATVVVVIVAARLLVPLLIPRLPLIILAALVIDAADQTILQRLTDVDTSETGLYQSYDKAMDVYYLSIAYLSTMRNWSSDAAFRIAQFLFYYRLVGTTLFELIGARVILLIFPNTFEYFFIAYEAIRIRYRPWLRSARTWALLAAGIWIFIKLPQEYWIHVAQLDFTDTVRDHPWFGVLIVVGLLALAVAAFLLRRRLPPAEHPARWQADELPPPVARELDRPHAPRRFLSASLFEKIALLGLVAVIFSQFLPSVDASPLQVVVAVVIVVVGNTALSEALARRTTRRVWPLAARFGALVAFNFALVLVTTAILGGSTRQWGTALFFAYLVSLLVWFYDAYAPVHEARVRAYGGVRSPQDLWGRVRERTP